MELIELQDIWQQYDKKLTENTRLNKEILRRMLLSKPARKLNWIKVIALINLILPIVAILLILVPRIVFRNEIDFYTGLLLFSVFSVITYYWSVRYYLLINRVDFANKITLIKKDIIQLEKYKIRITRLAYIFAVFGLVGIFLMCSFPIFSTNSILPISLIILVMTLSIYYTFRYSIFERFKKMKLELEEVEQLEE